MDFQTQSDKGELSSYIPNGEWELLGRFTHNPGLNNTIVSFNYLKLLKNIIRLETTVLKATTPHHHPLQLSQQLWTVELSTLFLNSIISALTCLKSLHTTPTVQFLVTCLFSQDVSWSIAVRHFENIKTLPVEIVNVTRYFMKMVGWYGEEFLAPRENH